MVNSFHTIPANDWVANSQLPVVSLATKQNLAILNKMLNTIPSDITTYEDSKVFINQLNDNAGLIHVTSLVLEYFEPAINVEDLNKLKGLQEKFDNYLSFFHAMENNAAESDFF
jgi:hypothetical protein